MTTTNVYAQETRTADEGVLDDVTMTAEATFDLETAHAGEEAEACQNDLELCRHELQECQISNEMFQELLLENEKQKGDIHALEDLVGGLQARLAEKDSKSRNCRIDEDYANFFNSDKDKSLIDKLVDKVKQVGSWIKDGIVKVYKKIVGGTEEEAKEAKEEREEGKKDKKSDKKSGKKTGLVQKVKNFFGKLKGDKKKD